MIEKMIGHNIRDQIAGIRIMERHLKLVYGLKSRGFCRATPTGTCDDRQRLMDFVLIDYSTHTSDAFQRFHGPQNRPFEGPTS
jgi:hypothetical protein